MGAAWRQAAFVCLGDVWWRVCARSGHRESLSHIKRTHCVADKNRYGKGMNYLVSLTVTVALAQISVQVALAAPAVSVPKRSYVCGALFQLMAHGYSDDRKISSSAIEKYNLTIRDMPSYSAETRNISQHDLDEIQQNIDTLQAVAVEQRNVLSILIRDCFVHYPPALILGN